MISKIITQYDEILKSDSLKNIRHSCHEGWTQNGSGSLLRKPDGMWLKCRYEKSGFCWKEFGPNAICTNFSVNCQYYISYRSADDSNLKHKDKRKYILKLCIKFFLVQNNSTTVHGVVQYESHCSVVATVNMTVGPPKDVTGQCIVSPILLTSVSGPTRSKHVAVLEQSCSSYVAEQDQTSVVFRTIHRHLNNKGDITMNRAK